MNLKDQRAAAIKAAQEIIAQAEAEKRELSDDEMTTLEVKQGEIEDLTSKIERHEKSASLVASLTSVKEPERVEPPVEAAKAPEGGVGERFVKSAAMKGLRESFSPQALRDTKNPIYVEAKGLGGAADLGIGTKATIDSTTGQASPQRLPGYRSELLDEPFSFLDLITTGSTEASWLEYAQIVSETNGAAIVPEGELKPLSDITTAKAEAKAHVYADGFDITNQTLADDGALAAFMESRIRWHVRNKVEDVIINGDATANVKGILTTTGVQQQAFATDVITTIAQALEKVEAVQANATAIVMNPADAWKLSLTKEAGVGYLLGNPLQQGLNPTPFGVRLVKSNRVAAGTALVGNFSSVQFLEREPLSVVAFNQHKDYAQRNMSYVRAELRGMQLVYAPREIVVATIAGA